MRWGDSQCSLSQKRDIWGNFGPQNGTIQFKNGPEIRLMLRKPYINGFRNVDWTF